VEKENEEKKDTRHGALCRFGHCATCHFPTAKEGLIGVSGRTE